MCMVVDSNYLRTKELREWIAASPKNIVVLTDQAEMEMAKLPDTEWAKRYADGCVSHEALSLLL